jgi:segregation and condensation protein B
VKKLLELAKKIFRKKPKRKPKAFVATQVPIPDPPPLPTLETEGEGEGKEKEQELSEDISKNAETQEEMVKKEIIENNIEETVEITDKDNGSSMEENTVDSTLDNNIEDTADNVDNEIEDESGSQNDEVVEETTDIEDRVEDNPADISEIIGGSAFGTETAQTEQGESSELEATVNAKNKEIPAVKKKAKKLELGEFEKNIRQRLEVLLFMTREPLSKEDLLKFLKCEREILERELFSLQTSYDSPEHGIQIIQIADKYQFATKAEYTKTVEDYINTPTEVSLSAAALETLAIIAYRQPITRTEVEAIRGVNSDGIVKSLLDKEFIEECGKAETVGRPTLYGTTDLFLKHFGLKDLQDLPAEPRALMESQEAEETLRIFRHSLVSQAELELNDAETVVEPTAAG